MRMWAGVAVAALMTIAGCGSAPTALPSTASSSNTAHATPSPDVARRQTAVYAAVVRRYLTSADSSFGEGHKWPVVYMLDHAVRGAADPQRVEGKGDDQAIPPVVRAALIEDLRDVAPLRFVKSRLDVVTPPEPGECQRVKRGGILITLAPVAATGDRVEIGVNGYVACLAATWLTYVVERNAQGWRVTGTTGPQAIS